jgi:hydrogenase nickel incorporation protein HypA/HybF
MAIAQSVLDIAFREMEKNGSCVIRKVKLSIGELSGAVKESLEFAFDVLRLDTPAESADFEIEVVPLRTDCADCGPIDRSFRDLNLLCPRCGKPMLITAGRDMKVDYLDLE